MRLLNFCFVAIVASVLVLSSCKKDDSPKDLLTDGAWTAANYEYEDTDGTFIADFENCEKDDTVTFNSDGTFTSSPGSDLCDPDDTSESGTFTLNEEGSVLTWTVDGQSIPFTVTELTSSRLVLEIDFFGSLVSNNI